MSPFVRPLLALLVGAALTEFLLFRVFLRLGPVLPTGEAASPVYRLIETIGMTALNLLVVASVALLATAVVQLRRRPGSVLLAGILATVVAVKLSAWLVRDPAAWFTVGQAIVMIGAIVAVAWTARRLPHGKLTLGLMAAAQVLALSYVLRQSLSGFGIEVPGGTAPLVLAEALAVGAAIALAWSVRERPTWRQVLAGGTVAVLFLVFDSVRPSTISTLSIWTVAFSLYLPSPVYALGLGVFVARVLALRSRPATTPLAIGLVLVAIAGLKADLSYVPLLWLLGLAISCGLIAQESEPVEREPGRLLRTIESVAR